MSKYYIYKQSSNIDSKSFFRPTRYTDGTSMDNVVAYTTVKDPATGETVKSYDFCVLGPGWRDWRYSLSKTEGEFYGVGNFCGYYSYSCWKNCELIADELFDINSEGELSIIMVEYKEPITYDVSDTYSMPWVIEFETDKEAIEYFVDFCTKKWEEENGRSK